MQLRGARKRACRHHQSPGEEARRSPTLSASMHASDRAGSHAYVPHSPMPRGSGGCNAVGGE
jgi:hypothetical protein